MNLVTRLLAIGALGAASLTQGCGCSSNNNSTNTTTEPPPPPPVTTVDVSGVAVKGLVSLARVTVHTLDANGMPSLNPIAETKTDNKGKYTIKLPNTLVNKPVSLRITPASDNTTQMTCDLATGCDNNVAFGQKFAVPGNSKLALETILSSLDQSNNVVNISTLTTIAAEHARKALTANADLTKLAAAIKKANGEIANIFSIVGELSQLELIDITDAEAVKAAVNGGKASALRLSALNAALVTASRSANPGFTLEQALAKLISDITGKGVASNSSDSTVADLTKILTALSDTLDQVKKLNASGVDLTELITTVLNDLGRVRNEPVDVYNTGVVLPDDSLFQKAYDFADIIRQLINSGDLVLDTPLTGTTPSTTIRAKSDKLRTQWAAAEMLSGPEMEDLGKSMNAAAEAIVEAADAYHYDAALTSFMAGDIKVSIAKTAQTVAYTVDQTIWGDTIKLMASEQHTDSTTDGVETGTGKFRLTGNASNAAIKISIGDSSGIDATKITRETKNNIETTSLEGLKVVLIGEVAQQAQANTVVDPVTASGTFRFDAANIQHAKGTSFDSSSSVGTYVLAFDGLVKNTTGEKFAFALNIAGSTKGVTIEQLAAGADPTDLSVTEDKYNNFTAIVSFYADLNTQLKAAAVRLTASRENLSTTRTALDLVFGAYNFRFATLVKRMADQPYDVTISNQDRLTMTLSQPTAGGKFTGKIMAPDGTKVLANIAQNDDGCVKVSRADNGKFFCLVDLR
ncbi:MAG: hypothetical protein U1F46_08385 [Marinagarivorans sp.]